MSVIRKAAAWCNGEVAYLAWESQAAIPDCLGFMITRIHETGPDAGLRRVLPTWIAFTGQSNPQWEDQDSSVWPIQQYQWRDLTLRKSRNSTAVRPIDFRVRYEIVPVGKPGPGRPKVTPQSPFKDATGKPRYEGSPHRLAILGPAVETNSVDVTHAYGDISATYTNGILSTQNLLKQLEAVQGPSAAATVAPGPATKLKPGLLTALKAHIPKENDPIRTFLTGDVLPFLSGMIDRADQAGGELYLALYELHDPELIRRLTALTAKGRAHVILSTAGQSDLNKKGTPPAERKPVVWDSENHKARAGLHAAKPANVQDRLFNNADHIGHNKFAVYVQNGVAKAALSGSTNWTETGLCTQSNNVILIEDEALATRYLEFWTRLRDDPQPAGQEISVTVGKKTEDGFAASKGVQGPTIRTQNAVPPTPVTLKDGKTTVELWCSPNTAKPVKNKLSPTPVDLRRVYTLMEEAQDAILFLSFLPGVNGEQNIIGQAADLAEVKPKLLVQGAISDPKALPPAKPGEPTTYTTPDGRTEKLPQRAIWWPGGDRGKVAIVRAAAVSRQIGDLKPELLTAGHAIIHDKVIVIDPLDAERCTVITGSHNMGYKASYQNDENMLIIRGNRALAISYAVHILDVYDHYVMRARLADELRSSLIATGLPPAADDGGGFLNLRDSWQGRWFDPGRAQSSRDYFLSRTALL